MKVKFLSTAICSSSLLMHAFISKALYVAALDADKMVVMMAVAKVLVTALAVTELDFAGKLLRKQKIELAVDGRLVDV